MPVVSVWLLRKKHFTAENAETAEGKKQGTEQGIRALPSSSAPSAFSAVNLYARLLEKIVRYRWGLVGGYLAVCDGVLLLAGSQVGTQIFPSVDSGQFLPRLRAATGTRIERTEEIARRVAALRLSFGPADIVNEIMSFGSPTPVEVVVYGPSQTDNLAYAAKVRAELEKVRDLRDLPMTQAQDYPTVRVEMDRQRLGKSGVTAQDAGRALLSATSSSRYVIPLYWADTVSGLGYQIQLQVPPPRMDSRQEVGQVPV